MGLFATRDAYSQRTREVGLMRVNDFRRPRRDASSLPGVSRWSRWGLHAARSLAIIGLASLLTGCTSLPIGSPSPFGSADKDGFFGWHVGAPYDTSDVKTVFVYFKTQTFRRDLQLMLTEAVTKEINLRTPYRVVGNPEQADSILRGVITIERQEPGGRGAHQPAARGQRDDDRLGELDAQPGDRDEEEAAPDPGHGGQQLRTRSRRDHVVRLYATRPDHRQADRGYDGTAVVQR